MYYRLKEHELPSSVSVNRRVSLPHFDINCLYQNDDCLRGIVEGDAVLETPGLYTLSWLSYAPRFSVLRPAPPRLLYSVALVLSVDSKLAFPPFSLWLMALAGRQTTHRC